MRVRGPDEPAREERARHEQIHLPYPSWSRVCVMGVGRQEGYFREAGRASDGGIPEVSIDYGFPASEGGTGVTVLVARERRGCGGPGPFIGGRRVRDGAPMRLRWSVGCRGRRRRTTRGQTAPASRPRWATGCRRRAWRRLRTRNPSRGGSRRPTSRSTATPPDALYHAERG